MLLVFGVLPRKPNHPIDLPNQREWMRALQNARERMGNIAAAARVREATTWKATSAVEYEIIVGNMFLVYWDTPIKK